MGLCDLTDTAQASRGDLSVAARGLYDFFRAYNQFWAPKYHLKSYIIHPISVLYLCGTNVPVWQSCDGVNYMSCLRPTALQFLKICHSQELTVDATAPENAYIN